MFSLRKTFKQNGGTQKKWLEERRDKMKSEVVAGFEINNIK